ncbi:auxin efflux carrier component 5-like [Olea europaea var. sylvestris]|uniref:auxin efflux carrier component 5-like n=1 Tax=Olea europaea var. sylvestris TaxID=158386 RepID=UPI000C1D8504|nr:auxin efflux carrier component 5-like [Olea europaea var. sylvestris]
MIAWEDIYKIVVAMVPFYAALALGYASIRWWHMFKPDHFDAINRFNCYFIMPFFTFEFTAHVNPYKMNYLFLAADVIAKVVVGIVLALWANLSSKGKYDWSVTCFSLSSLNNTLVVGVPLLKAMYDQMGADLVIQSSVIQSLFWFPALLFMLEFRRTRCETSAISTAPVLDDRQVNLSSIEMGRNDDIVDESTNSIVSNTPSFLPLMKTVWSKLAKNPNSYACFLGIIWALIAYRWHFQMPSILEGSILIMSRAGGAVAMFSMGLFMALQEKVISCGVRLTLLGMVLRFVGGPISMAIGCFALGLRGDIVRVAIIQAALPQSIASFVFAQEYGLHSELLSTAVIFGTMISLPLLIGYYTIFDSIH